MQASDGLFRVLEREISHLIVLPVFFAGVGGAWTVPPLLSDGLDDAAVLEVMRPRVMDGQYTSALPPSFLRTGRMSRLDLRAEGSAAATSSADPLRFFFFFPPKDEPAWGSEALASLMLRQPDCRS